MAIYDDGSVSILDWLRPASEISRLEPSADRVSSAQHLLGLGMIVRVIAPSLREPHPTSRAAELLQLGLQELLDEPACATWREHLHAAEAWAGRLSDVLAQSRIALLSAGADDGERASLSWFPDPQTPIPQLSMAAWLPLWTRRRGPRVTMDVDVRCDMCGKLQHAAGSELHWFGSRSSIELQVAPICMTCLGTTARDPARWEQLRLGVASSGLRLISGEGVREERSKDRAHLRLVLERSL